MKIKDRERENNNKSRQGLNIQVAKQHVDPISFAWDGF
jgi:hypothetical protein